MKPKRHVCTCLTPATHWCPKTGGQYCQQHAEHYASVFGEESLKTFPADKAKPAINKSSELNAANSEIERLRKANLQLREGAEEQKQRIKRLEEAGDALAKHHLLVVTTYDKAKAHVADWRKAKEAKP